MADLIAIHEVDGTLIAIGRIDPDGYAGKESTNLGTVDFPSDLTVDRNGVSNYKISAGALVVV